MLIKLFKNLRNDTRLFAKNFVMIFIPFLFGFSLFISALYITEKKADLEVWKKISSSDSGQAHDRNGLLTFQTIHPFIHERPEGTGREKIETICRRIIELTSQPLEHEGEACKVTVSIGISMSPADGEAPEVLIRNTDAAMYSVKREGKNGYRFFADGVEGIM